MPHKDVPTKRGLTPFLHRQTVRPRTQIQSQPDPIPLCLCAEQRTPSVGDPGQGGAKVTGKLPQMLRRPSVVDQADIDI